MSDLELNIWLEENLKLIILNIIEVMLSLKCRNYQWIDTKALF